ncbi:hypothetical protein ACH4CD_10130 [Streptomyces fungicidicus]|uniref:hypothetical protein n=1 Tax=Streptomyces fungicidicus TaxID=68203 RepID=UPI00378795B5
MNSLEISFRVPGPAGPGPSATAPPAVVALGRRHFRVHAGRQGYVLPEVLAEREAGTPGHLSVHLPPRVEVRAEQGTLIPAQLAHALETVWAPQDYTVAGVDGPRILSREARLPVSVVYGDPRAAGFTGPGPGQELRIDVHWSVEYTGSAGTDTAAGSVTLEFAPPGEQPPDPAAAAERGDADDEFLRLRPPQPSTDSLQQFVAVDLGSTASTATLWDLGRITHKLVDPSRTAALADMLTGLLAPPSDAPEEWRRTVEGILSGDVVLGRRGGQRITGRQALSRLDDPHTVDALMVKVEQALREDGRPALRDWLVPRLFEGYARVLQTPVLDRQRLRPVDYTDVTGERTMAPASALVEQPPEPHESRIGRVEPDGGLTFTGVRTPGERRFHLQGPLEPGVTAITGIKRALLQQQPPPLDGTDMSAVHLAQHLYLRLVERTEELLHRPAGREQPTVRTAVVTYPTTILPEIKLRVEKLVRAGLGIPQVVMDYDEGLAASLFFVMRELSDNQNLGLEAMRSRSRRVGDDPPTWHRILLAIDIGGCTTDIALLRVALVDGTPALTGEQRFVSGRDYRLEPVLLGSTGHGQLGGDLLTLQVLYWLKACFVDQLAPDATPSAPGTAADGSAGRTLSTRVAEQAADALATIVTPDVRLTLDELLPTNWGDEDVPEDEREGLKRRFYALWALAEHKKCTLGQDGDGPSDAALTINRTDVQKILDAAPHGLGEVKEVVLDPADFRRLMDPVLRRAAEMGADLVRTVFTHIHDDNAEQVARGREPGPSPVLDQVVLSGRSSALDQVGEIVTDVLTKADSGTQLRLGWNPTALSVERGDIAKQATSLGAAWAHSTRALAGQMARRDELSAMDPLIRLSELDIRTQGLFNSLPSDFGAAAEGGANVLTLLRAGTPFAELDARGRRGVRTGWRPLTDMVMLHRATSSRDSILWGSFNLFLAAHDESLSQPLAEVWRRKDGSGVNYRMELDQELFPYILLCHGAPRLLVTGQALEPADTCPGWGSGTGPGGSPPPGSICVSPDEPGAGRPELVEVFPAARDAEPYFDTLFNDTTDPEEPPVPGRTAAVGAPPRDGAHHFYLLREGSGEAEYLGRLPAPGGTEHRATLDARGRLRLHRGAVPYLPAETLREVEQHPGRVLHRPMNSGTTDVNAYWDPWTGRH